MLKSRLDKEYSCFDGTCNPAGPGHWFKKFLDSDADIFSQQYGIDDNPFLPESVRAALKREYTGVFYQRYILGQWVAAEGAVYPMFERGRHVSANAPDTRFTWVGVDYGHTNPTAFVRAGIGRGWARVGAGGILPRIRRDGGARSPRQYAATSSTSRAAAPAWSSTPRRRASSCNCTRTAPPCGLKRPTTPCWRACNWFRRRWTRGKLMFHPRCERLIAEMEGYRWDERARERGEDKPRKEDDHAVDALRYGLMHYRRDVRSSAGRERDESSQRRKTMLERFWEWARRLFAGARSCRAKRPWAARAEADYRRADGVNLTCIFRLAAGEHRHVRRRPQRLRAAGRGTHAARGGGGGGFGGRVFPRAEPHRAGSGHGWACAAALRGGRQGALSGRGAGPLLRHRHAGRADHRRHGAGGAGRGGRAYLLPLDGLRAGKRRADHLHQG